MQTSSRRVRDSHSPVRLPPIKGGGDVSAEGDEGGQAQEASASVVEGGKGVGKGGTTGMLVICICMCVEVC